MWGGVSPSHWVLPLGLESWDVYAPSATVKSFLDFHVKCRVYAFSLQKKLLMSRNREGEERNLPLGDIDVKRRGMVETFARGLTPQPPPRQLPR